MILILYEIIAILIIAWAIPTAFDPKYRYNEHCKYEPEFWEIAWQWILAMWVIGAIILK